MAERLKAHPHPDYIISTTVLSHGVNLPDISKIYFLYVVENLDFWIQMTARGGRRGERYQVFALERPTDLNWSYLRNFIQVLWLGFKRKYSLSQLA
jgi:superfamily II DNA or RNA helicase